MAKGASGGKTGIKEGATPAKILPVTVTKPPKK